jgi:hypothetical protein
MKRWGAIGACLVFVCAAFSAFSQDPCDFAIRALSLNSNQFRFSFTGESEIFYSIETSTNLQTWIPTANGLLGGFSRTIDLSTSAPSAFYRVVRGSALPFVGALVARQTVNAKGNTLVTDSYDSMDPNHSTNGLYNAATRKAGGNVCVSESVVVSVANASIYGRVKVGPTGTVSVGPNGRVGDLDWIGPGIQPGWFGNDLRICWPEVKPPYSSGFAVPLGTGAPAPPPLLA